MLQAANIDLFNPFVPNASVKSTKISFQNYASKGQLKLLCGFLFFAPSALMGY